MSFSAEDLYQLLPAAYRTEDARIGGRDGGPLKAYLTLFAEQIAALEDNLEQLYDDQFIETCAEWVVPYLGDLIGARLLDDLKHADVPIAIKRALSGRAQVANAIALRRRKGTLAALEQAARDATGWPTRAVEYWRRLAATTHVKHVRTEPGFFADLRRGEALDLGTTPFDPLPRSVEVRRVACERGRYNIPNVGVHFFRLRAFGISGAAAHRAGVRRYLFHPLGLDTPLYNRPETEEDIEHLAERRNVPLPISRRALHHRLADLYGPAKSIRLWVDGEEVPGDAVVACDLTEWKRQPQDHYGIDPVLGRIALPQNESDTTEVKVSYYYAFSGVLGAGPFLRDLSTPEVVLSAGEGEDHPTVQGALDELSGAGAGAVEVVDHGLYEENLELQAEGSLELRAAVGKRPVFLSPTGWTIEGNGDAAVVLDGLTVSGAPLRVGAGVGHLVLRHCTLIPRTGEPSLVVLGDTRVVIERSIVGAISASTGTAIEASGAIVDATSSAEMAISGEPDRLDVDRSTVIGGFRTRALDASNSIFLADLDEAVIAVRKRQEGCVRYCFLPAGAKTPKRFHCLPRGADPDLRPVFTSLAFASPAYGQLSPWCPREIRTGADDGAEMGAFHDLFQPQRESNARIRIEEMQRFGTESGIFYET